MGFSRRLSDALSGLDAKVGTCAYHIFPEERRDDPDRLVLLSRNLLGESDDRRLRFSSM